MGTLSLQAKKDSEMEEMEFEKGREREIDGREEEAE